MKWQPIETHPRDVEVLLKLGDVIYFGTFSKKGAVRECWQISGFDDEEYSESLHHPSFWAPLPED